MSFTELLSQLVGSASDTTLLLGAIIAICALLFEDASTIIVGVLASDGSIPLMVGLIPLYIGVMLGDICFYTIGYLARTHPKLDRYVDHAYIVPIRTWLKARYALTIFSARFIPGTRLPTYMASGFFRASFLTFLLMDALGVFLWTSALFFVAYWFGSTTGWLGPVRYGLAAILLLLLFFIGRHNLGVYRKMVREHSETAS